MNASNVTIITSRTDLATYIADIRMDLTDRYVDAVLDQLQASDHPTWGEDWSEWLGEWVDSVITETVDGLDALNSTRNDEKVSK